MKFVALFTGSGEGCDYTIGCNKKFHVFHADNYKDATSVCKRVWEDHGGSQGQPYIESIQLFVVEEEHIDLPVGQWNAEDKIQIEKERLQDELRKVEVRAAELRSKL